MPRKTPGIFYRADRRTWYVRIKTAGREIRRAAGPTKQEALELAARMA